MKSYRSIYLEIYSLKNLALAWRKARKGKTRKQYVKEFEIGLFENLLEIQKELEKNIYFPKPLKHFILRDPKTRRISKSEFRDRIVHHALCNIIEPLFEKSFIYDSCANRKKKGSIKAIERLSTFKRKITNNLTSRGYCIKADIKHYFQEVDRTILFSILKRKINCECTLNLIKKILDNFEGVKGMPLGNLTSQFFANVYLNELDKFIKHKLKAKYYIRYVDDFILLHKSKKQLTSWKLKICIFLKEKLSLELHPDKSKIINFSKGVDFVGFRNFYYYRLLRKRNRKSMKNKNDILSTLKCGVSIG
jgi:RNA-directed DNA polymerase